MIYNKENLYRRKELRMKKLLAIIAVLLVILIGMIIYRNSQNQVKNISVEEVSSIEQYLQKNICIYPAGPDGDRRCQQLCRFH